MKPNFVGALAPLMLWGGVLCAFSSVRAQESLAGVGAAGAMGATLGAAAGTSVSGSGATRGGGGGGSREGSGGGASESGGQGGAAGAGATKGPALGPPRAVNGGLTGQAYIGELLSAPRRVQPIPERVKRTPRNQARYSRRVARLSPSARAKLVAQKYKIPPRSWLASYLPQDRYKFGKAWKFVSVETDRFYYRPADMARKRFNPNRVIGFFSFQDALIAGYRPDPVSRPEPGAALVQIAGLTRGPQFYRYVEYLYSGQVTPSSFNATYRYALNVNRALRPVSYARAYIGSTVEKVLEASITGDTSIIPTTFESPQAQIARAKAQAAKAATTQGGDARGGTGSGSSSPGGSTDRRQEDFNNFGNRAGSMANVPANR